MTHAQTSHFAPTKCRVFTLDLHILTKIWAFSPKLPLGDPMPNSVADEHFADIIWFLSMGTTPKGFAKEQKKEFVARETDFFCYCRALI